MVEHCEIEAREVKELGHPGVGEQPLQPGRAIAAWRELDQMRVPVSGRELDEAQPVAMRVEPHRLGVDRDR